MNNNFLISVSAQLPIRVIQKTFIYSSPTSEKVNIKKTSTRNIAKQYKKDINEVQEKRLVHCPLYFMDS
jgi:hypothetical protein